QHHQKLQPGPPELRVEPSLVVADLQAGSDRVDVRHDFILTGEREASLLVLARRGVGGVIPHTHSPVEIRNGSSRAKPNTTTRGLEARKSVADRPATLAEDRVGEVRRERVTDATSSCDGFRSRDTVENPVVVVLLGTEQAPRLGVIPLDPNQRLPVTTLLDSPSSPVEDPGNVAKCGVLRQLLRLRGTKGQHPGVLAAAGLTASAPRASPPDRVGQAAAAAPTGSIACGDGNLLGLGARVGVGVGVITVTGLAVVIVLGILEAEALQQPACLSFLALGSLDPGFDLGVNIVNRLSDRDGRLE